jgi:predicted TIM-barrel fold metal-dependent hydrolase
MPPEMERWAEKMRAEHDIRLSEWKPVSNAVVPVTNVEQAKFPVIDVHKHIGTDGNSIAAGLAAMDATNVKAVVHLTGGFGARLQETIDNLKSHAGRFAVCTQIDWSTIDDPDFSAKAVRNLEQARDMGAQCLKLTKVLGLYVKDKNKQFVAINDPRFDPLWAKCAELNFPVMIHVADPVAFFRSWDETNEAYVALLNHPEWYFHGKDYEGTERFSFEEIIRQRNDIVARHPKTTFVALHYASLSHDLGAVAKLLDRYPNLMVEMGARNWALGTAPNSGRKFAIQYADRILFGTDGGIRAEQFREYIRTLETDDDMISFRTPSPWGPIYGVHLPDDVLRKIYNENAKKLFPSLR